MTNEQIRAVFNEKHTGGNWINNPIVMSQLKSAVQKRADTVTFGEGDEAVEYRISYDHTFKWKTAQEIDRCVLLERTDGGLIPWGYVPLRIIEQFEFEKS